MKINVLLIFITTVGIIGIAGNDSDAVRDINELHKNCIQCHGAQWEQASRKNPSLVALVPELCYGCHKEHLPQDGWVHGPVATGKCLLCHDPHKTDSKSMLINSIPELCRQCHVAGSLESVVNHSKKSYAQCDDCHNDHISPGRMLLKQDFFETDAGKVYIRKNPSVRPLFTFTGHRGSLSKLSSIKVITDIKKSDLLKRYGLTKNALKTKIEMQLLQYGIGPIDPKERTAQQSCLFVDLRLVEVQSPKKSGQVDALSGRLNVFFRQKMELLDNNRDSTKRFGLVTNWN